MITRKVNLAPILEAMEDGVCIIGDDYTIEYMNRAMVSLFGEGLGRKCYEIINNGPTQCEFCESEKVLKGETVRLDCFVEHLNRNFNMIDVPLETDGDVVSKWAGIWKDTTEIKRQTEKRKSSEENYARLFENVGCGVFISTKDGKFLNANQALLDMLGYRKKRDFLKMDIEHDIYLKPEDRGIYREMIKKTGRSPITSWILKCETVSRYRFRSPAMSGMMQTETFWDMKASWWI